MSGFGQALDRIAQSDDAVFAIDCQDRLVVWNRSCEMLLGHRAERVLGRPCYEVLGGRDVHGNVYCFPNCPVAHQARARRDDPVRSFRLCVPTPGRDGKWVRVSMFVIPCPEPTLGAVVHVLREERSALSALEQHLATEEVDSAVAEEAPAALPGVAQHLTPREREILRNMAQAMTTAAMARRLGISQVTVRNHVQRIIQKLGVHTKLSAVVLAYRHRLI